MVVTLDHRDLKTFSMEVDQLTTKIYQVWPVYYCEQAWLWFKTFAHKSLLLLLDENLDIPHGMYQTRSKWDTPCQCTSISTTLQLESYWWNPSTPSSVCTSLGCLLSNSEFPMPNLTTYICWSCYKHLSCHVLLERFDVFLHVLLRWIVCCGYGTPQFHYSSKKWDRFEIHKYRII